jgi:hypothetical protein
MPESQKNTGIVSMNQTGFKRLLVACLVVCAASASDIPPGRMHAIYEEVKTPYKYVPGPAAEADRTADEKIMEFLVEARELAMDGSSSEEKHGIFRKYMGKINNYLVAEGYTLE